MSFFIKQEGQAVVEGAFLIPVLLLVFMLLIQPSIILYDRIVMQAAASEGCRVLVSSDGLSNSAGSSTESFVRNRLSAIPQQDNFHLHQGACSWDIRLSGSESSETVSVSITNQLKLLPFFDVCAAALGIVNAEGNFEIKIETTYTAKDSWVLANEKGLSPSSWVAQWK